MAIKVSLKVHIRRMEMEDRGRMKFEFIQALAKHVNVVKVLTYFEDEDNIFSHGTMQSW